MKGPVRDPASYAFVAAARTLEFSAPIPTHQGQIIGVINNTRNTLIYAAAKSGYGGSWTSPVLTLLFDTTGHSNSDSLTVICDDGSIFQPTAPDVAFNAGETTAKTQRVVTANPPFMRVGFAESGAGIVGKAAEELSPIQTGPGMTVSQANGNLLITTGTTANAETVIRSIRTFSGSMLTRMKTILSQRIINQNFRYELADLIGESLGYTVNSATSVTVTFPSVNPFTAANVGQSVRLSQITDINAIPGRYAIASVSGLDVTFTVAAWPASGTGTLTLYGWNYVVIDYNGGTPTTHQFDAQRRGWSSGLTSHSGSTTNSPGVVAQLALDVFTVGDADSLPSSNIAYQWTNRASRIENIPDPEVPLHVLIVAQNGSTPPGGTTTWTIGFVQVEDQGRQKVRIASSDPVGSHALPVQVLGANLTFIGGGSVSGGVAPNGGSTTTLPVFSCAVIIQTDYSAQNVAAASGSLSAIAQSVNASCLGFDINLTAWTAGSSTGLDLFLQESPDGTRFYDIWQVEALTSVTAARIPAIPVNGRRRFRWVNRGGAAGTATLTITSIQTPAALPIQRQFFDRTAGVGSGTVTAATNGAIHDIQGCKNISIKLNHGTATANASFRPMVSDDGSNFVQAGPTMFPVGTGAGMSPMFLWAGVTGRFLRIESVTAGTSQVMNYIAINAIQ